jgi:hypothetical protein
MVLVAINLCIEPFPNRREKPSTPAEPDQIGTIPGEDKISSQFSVFSSQFSVLFQSPAAAATRYLPESRATC